MDNQNKITTPQKEPRVLPVLWQIIFFGSGVFNLIRAIFCFFFPTHVMDMEDWPMYLASAAFFGGIGYLLYRLRQKDLAKHRAWEEDLAAWKWEEHKREVERMELEIQLTKAQTEMIKARIDADDL